LADLAVLSQDYFGVPEEQIKSIESVMTIVGGRVVFAAAPFERYAPTPLPVSPDWSPPLLPGRASAPVSPASFAGIGCPCSVF
jgi:hypothetical protein